MVHRNKAEIKGKKMKGGERGREKGVANLQISYAWN